MGSQAKGRSRFKVWVALCIASWALASTSAANAACRVTEFSDRSMASLNEIERLSFAALMTQTEFDKLKAAAPGTPNHYALIANSASAADARKAAQDKIASLKIVFSKAYQKIWKSDFLTDEQLQHLGACTSHRIPGITWGGRPDGPGKFNLTLSHLTPVGVEEITIELVASYNVANADEFEAALTAMGKHDNFAPKTFPLRLRDPKKRAVLIVRAGYETPAEIFIPVYPAPDVRP